MSQGTLHPPCMMGGGAPTGDSRRSASDVVGAVLVTGAVYLTWGLATYLLEGAPQTLLRPEAQADRLAYAVVANLLTGAILPLWALRVLATWVGQSGPLRLGRFCTAPRTVISVAAAGLIGLVLLVQLLPVVRAPAAYLNVLAQVLPTSVAEVVVCWVLVGGAVDVSFGVRASAAAGAVKWVLGAALFGVYHFAHSPPYDSWPSVAFLTGIGLLTGAFFLTTGEVYGTIVFHSTLATVGVMGSVIKAGGLSFYLASQPFLYLIAFASVVLLVVLDAVWFRGAAREPPSGRG